MNKFDTWLCTYGPELHYFVMPIIFTIFLDIILWHINFDYEWKLTLISMSFIIPVVYFVRYVIDGGCWCNYG